MYLRDVKGEKTMIQARRPNRKSIPWWAALGAPLIGIPLLVALVALTAPTERISAIDEDPSVRCERLDVRSVEYSLDGLIAAELFEG